METMMEASNEIREVIRAIKRLEAKADELPKWKGEIIKNINHYLLMDLRMLVSQLHILELKDEFK